MRVFVTGKGGFIGRHVTALLLAQGHKLCGITERPNAMIHLAWAGLPDYENRAHYHNVQWQAELIATAAALGCRNINVAGTCWETCPNPPPYVAAKLQLFNRLRDLPITLKWVRAPYLYGDGQRPECLLPSLMRAIVQGRREFRVAPVALPFMHVLNFAQRLVDSIGDPRNQISNLAGAAMRVADFCRAQVPESAGINLIEDYPLKPWEK